MRYAIIVLLLAACADTADTHHGTWEGAWRIESAYLLDSAGLTPCSDGSSPEKRGPLPAWMAVPANPGDSLVIVESDGKPYEQPAWAPRHDGGIHLRGGIVVRGWTSSGVDLYPGAVAHWQWYWSADGPGGATCTVILVPAME